MAKIQFKWHGDKANAIAKKAVRNALGVCALGLQGVSADLAPVDTGDLRANCIVVFKDGEVNGPKRPHPEYDQKFIDKAQTELNSMGDNYEGVIVGYSLPYSEVQHERLDFNHPKGGGPKYLENPFNANKSKFEKMIKTTVKDALKKER